MPQTISQSAARSHILRRQGLVERYPDPLQAVRAMIAVQTQYPASVGPAIAARAKGVTSKWVEKALTKDRSLLKGWSVRSTLHAHAAEDHLEILQALRFRVDYYRRLMETWHKVTPAQLEELHREILAELEQGPQGRRAIHERVPIFKTLPMIGWGFDMMGLAFEGKVVLANQAASNTTFARLDTWAPGLQRPAGSEEDAIVELMRRYFAGYGPATYADFRAWSGFANARAARSFRRLEPELETVTVEGMKGQRYFVGASAPPTGRLPLRLLPKFDVLLMGYKDRTLFLRDEDKSKVFRPAGQVEATVLSNGNVSGTWRTQRKGQVLEFTVIPFRRFGSREEGAIENEAKIVARSLGFVKIELTIQAAS